LLVAGHSSKAVRHGQRHVVSKRSRCNMGSASKGTIQQDTSRISHEPAEEKGTKTFSRRDENLERRAVV